MARWLASAMAPYAFAAALLWAAQRGLWGFDFLQAASWKALVEAFTEGPGVPVGLVLSFPAALASALALRWLGRRMARAVDGPVLLLVIGCAGLAAAALWTAQRLLWSFDYLEPGHWAVLGRGLASGRVKWEFLASFAAAAAAAATAFLLAAPRLEALLEVRARGEGAAARRRPSAAKSARASSPLPEPEAFSVPPERQEESLRVECGQEKGSVPDSASGAAGTEDAEGDESKRPREEAAAWDTDVDAESVPETPADGAGGTGEASTVVMIGDALRDAGFQTWEEPPGAPGFAAVGLRQGGDGAKLVLVRACGLQGRWRAEEVRWRSVTMPEGGMDSPLVAALEALNEVRDRHADAFRRLDLSEEAVVAVRGGFLEEAPAVAGAAAEAGLWLCARGSGRTDGLQSLAGVLEQLALAAGVDPAGWSEVRQAALDYVAREIGGRPTPVEDAP